MNDKADWTAVLEHHRSLYKLSHEAAAQALDVPISTYNHYLNAASKRAPSGKFAAKILSALGRNSLNEALASIDANAHTRYYKSLMKESESRFAANFASSGVVYETRIFLPNPPAPSVSYRQKLNELVRDRILAGKLHLHRVEMVTGVDRLVELWVNKEFVFKNAKSQYVIKLLPLLSASMPEREPHPRQHFNWIPFLNFSVFDERAVLFGGFHNSAPLDEPFGEIFDPASAVFFKTYWQKMASEAEEFSVVDGNIDRLIDFLRHVPGGRKITKSGFNEKVEKLREIMKSRNGVNYIPRW